MPQRSVTVQVPATSANLGPGFDCLGVALDWTARVRVTASDEPQPRPAGPIEQMVVGAALALYGRALAPNPAGIAVEYQSDIPVGRGLGVSAIARVAGLLAAARLIGGEFEAESLLPLAFQLERHGDNVVPAMFGGIQVVVGDDEGVAHVRVEPPSDLRLVLLIPELSMPTDETRKRLPEQFSRNQAVHNIGRAAMLVAALSQRRYDLLHIATEDVLHQPARGTIFKPMYPIFQAARDAGALGVFLSGGGPTIAAFATERFEDIAGAMREIAAAHGVASTSRVCALSGAGAVLVEE